MEEGEHVGTAARLAALRAAIADDADPTHELAHTVTLELLERAGQVDAGHLCLGWEQFPDAAVALIGADEWAMTVAVMANLIAVVDFGEEADLVTLAALVERYGHPAVAAVQTEVDGWLGTGSPMPLASRFMWRVARCNTEREVGRTCYRSAFWLLIADINPDAPGRELRTVEDAVKCADFGGLRAWRAQVAIVAGNPWAPYPVVLHEMLLTGDRPAPAAALDAVIKHYREISEREDRQLVAREIRRLVAVSGLSQRQFAAMCGTSAPRLSTYVNGLVTPSASMMVRFARVSERAQQQARRERDTSA